MCTITLTNTGEGIPESLCSSCEVRFNIAWQRDAVYQAPGYCPFCGEEIDEFVSVEGEQRDER